MITDGLKPDRLEAMQLRSTAGSLQLIVKLMFGLVTVTFAASFTEKVCVVVPAVPTSGVPIILPVEASRDSPLGSSGVTSQLL